VTDQSLAGQRDKLYDLTPQTRQLEVVEAAAIRSSRMADHKSLIALNEANLPRAPERRKKFHVRVARSDHETRFDLKSTRSPMVAAIGRILFKLLCFIFLQIEREI
jgi:hypothetical protein